MLFENSKTFPLFGIIDCNNFYVSCERVFQPHLENKPVVVLSNNDGCVISRCNYTKKLGIPMAAPYFKYKLIFEQHNVTVFSSNYRLYGDMSRRIMSMLTNLVPKIEVYSIDEAFLDLSGFSSDDLQKLSEHIIASIEQGTGIPVTLGIGPTKTLAKFANKVAKLNNLKIFNISSESMQAKWLHQLEIKDVWGIGRQWAKKLNALGIHTAEDLKKFDAWNLKKRFSITLASTALELQGQVVFNLEDSIPPKKGIVASRSFAHTLTEFNSISQALCFHVARACEKVRKQNSLVKTMIVFLNTSRFKNKNEPYWFSQTIELVVASDDTRMIAKAAIGALKSIFKSGKEYKKTGIMFIELVSKKHLQLDLFAPALVAPESDKVMEIMDKINIKMGRNTLRIAAQGHHSPMMQNTFISKAYTTSWKDLLIVKASFN